MRTVEQFSQDFKNTFVLGTKEYKKKAWKTISESVFFIIKDVVL